MSEGWSEFIGLFVFGVLAYVVYKADDWEPDEPKVRRVLTDAIRECVADAEIMEIEETDELGPFGPVDIDWRGPVVGSRHMSERMSPTKYYKITLAVGDKFHAKISSTLHWVRHAAVKRL